MCDPPNYVAEMRRRWVDESQGLKGSERLSINRAIACVLGSKLIRFASLIRRQKRRSDMQPSVHQKAAPFADDD
jgi:hypothetical protein